MEPGVMEKPNNLDLQENQNQNYDMFVSASTKIPHF